MPSINNLKKYFSPKPTTLLGLDLAHDVLRLVEISKVKQNYFLNTCVEIGLSAVGTSEHSFWQHPDFPNFLKETIQDANISTRKVAIALPYSSVLFKTIELDKQLTEAEILLQIQAHAEQYFNYPISELMMDFELMGSVKNHPNLCEVRWVVAKRSEVAPQIHALTMAGLIPAVIEVDIYALQRAAGFLLSNDLFKDPVYLSLQNHTAKNSYLFAIIHISTSQLLFIVLNQEKVIYTRVENDAITPDTDLNATKVFAILRAINLFLSSAPDQKIALILLSGNVSADLLAAIQNQLNIETHYLDVLKFLNSSLEKTIPHQFAISAGLAMRVQS